MRYRTSTESQNSNYFYPLLNIPTINNFYSCGLFNNKANNSGYIVSYHRQTNESTVKDVEWNNHGLVWGALLVWTGEMTKATQWARLWTDIWPWDLSHTKQQHSVVACHPNADIRVLLWVLTYQRLYWEGHYFPGMQSSRHILTFQGIIKPPSSRQKSKPSKKPRVWINLCPWRTEVVHISQTWTYVRHLATTNSPNAMDLYILRTCRN
jgi:hypothetical protein